MLRARGADLTTPETGGAISNEMPQRHFRGPSVDELAAIEHR
jgi:hypothetical protein